MNCRCVANLMSAYVDGELTGTEMLIIRRHISECPECAREHESMRMIKHAVSRLGSVTPRSDFAASIFAKLDEVQIPPFQRRINALLAFLHHRLSPVAAALAASGVALVILSAGGMDTMPPMAAQSEPANPASYRVSLLSPMREQAAMSPAHLLEVPTAALPDNQPTFNLVSLSR